MGKYGEIAIKAADYITKGLTPEESWEKASCEIFQRGSASQLKSCPRAAFLGLYGGTGKNAEYARAAVNYLKENPNEDITERELWKIVMKGNNKAYNQQMDVVLTLFKNNLLK